MRRHAHSRMLHTHTTPRANRASARRSPPAHLACPCACYRHAVCPSLTTLPALLPPQVLSSQPFVSYDWSPDKEGLGVGSCLDQTVRVFIVTKLHLY